MRLPRPLHNPRRMAALRVACVSLALALFGAILAFAAGAAIESPLGKSGIILGLMGITGVWVSTLFAFALDVAAILRWFRKALLKPYAATHGRGDRRPRQLPRGWRRVTWRVTLVILGLSLISGMLALALFTFLDSPLGKNPVSILVLGGIGAIGAIFVTHALYTTAGWEWLQKTLLYLYGDASDKKDKPA